MRSSVNSARGAVRFEIVLVLALLLVLLGVFLLRVQTLQRDMERMMVDAETTSLRTALLMAVASKVAQGEEQSLGGWDGKNPLRLLESDVVSGLSPTVSAGGASLSRSWQWHPEHRALEYEYAEGEVLRLRLAFRPTGERDAWALGAGLFLVRERPNVD